MFVIRMNSTSEDHGERAAAAEEGYKRKGNGNGNVKADETGDEYWAELLKDVTIAPERAKDGTCMFTFAHFIAFVRVYPLVLMPIFGAQDDVSVWLSYGCHHGAQHWRLQPCIIE